MNTPDYEARNTASLALDKIETHIADCAEYRRETRAMFKWLIGLIVAGLGALAFLTIQSLIKPAHAQTGPNCAAYEPLKDRLEGVYKERSIVSGVTAAGLLMEMLAAESGTWTIIVIYPTGQACMYLSGDGLKQAVPGRRS